MFTPLSLFMIHEQDNFMNKTLFYATAVLLFRVPEQVRNMIITLFSNRIGRDFIVGDLHGAFSELNALLEHVQFDASKDRLIAVGDLFDRGTSPQDSLPLLSQSWFHAVRGNHEHNLILWNNAVAHEQKQAARLQILAAGGEWFFSLPEHEQENLCRQIADLPLAILLSSHGKRYCVIHAEVAQGYNDIDAFLMALLNEEPTVLHHCLSGRKRHKSADTRPIANIDWIVCGHTPVLPANRIRGNSINLDYGLPSRHPMSALGMYETGVDTLWLCHQPLRVSKYSDQ